MINSTKSVQALPVKKSTLDRFLLKMELEKNFQILKEEFQKKMDSKEWIELNNANYYFVPEDYLIVPNPKKIRMSSDHFVELPGLKWDRMTKAIAEKWFRYGRTRNPLIKNNMIEYENVLEYKDSTNYVYCNDASSSMEIGAYGTMKNYMPGIRIPIYKFSQVEQHHVLKFLIEKGFKPFDKEPLLNLCYLFSWMLQNSLLEINGTTPVFRIDGQHSYDSVCANIKRLGVDFKSGKSEGTKNYRGGNLNLDQDTIREITEELLACDKRRVNMEVYPEHILTDPESGHWELWEEGSNELRANTSTKFIARNPVYDALENKSGVVGIDFGTKSTVVTYRQSRADVLPMRIGSGQFSRTVSKEDYENPTVIELRNVEKFLKEYEQRAGRPNTCWEDLLISHEASEQMKSEQSKGDTFATFFSELKQWASDKSRQVRLKDLKGAEINIPSYLSLTENDFDPIEIYAYYLGLFINNMVHKIYLRYKLSFPATVEKAVRDKILESFTKGIKKSLPVQVLNDAQCMKIFKVEQGASEPAAYAITALYGYGFDPEEDEKHCYAIFDFGGGTTDFDFGIWSAEEEEPENFDYQISHFGQGGDPYLGGENLLQILAYHVFVKNYDRLLKDKIVFVRPFGEKEIPGKDYLVCQDSQYAHFNQKRMMEKLRGVWEDKVEVRESLQSGSIALPLFAMDGEVKNNYSLEIDLDELDQLLEQRIDKGVSQFFEALKNCFDVSETLQEIGYVDGINIFLAGNSSKSPIVYKIFKKYIDLIESGLAEKIGKRLNCFKLYPPLGTLISDRILEGTLKPSVDDILSYLDNTKETLPSERKREKNAFDVGVLNKPTGKTGVAYGLLNNRVRVVQNEAEEIGFRYYIGQNRKSKFFCIIDKDKQKYNEWVKFCTASREDFDIWFTRSAAAPSKTLPIDQIGVYSETGFVAEPSKEKAVYIRLVSPTEIEYVVASDEEIKKSSFAEAMIERVSLQEKQ